MQQLQELQTQYTECCMLIDRYENLKSQYQADLDRLNFIVDSKANLGTTTTAKCPICEGHIVVEKSSHIVAAQAVCPQAAQNSCPSILLIKYVQHGTAEHGDSAPIPPRFNAFVLHKGNIKGRKQGGIIPPMLPLAEPRRALGLLLSIALSSRRVRALNFLATS